MLKDAVAVCDEMKRTESGEFSEVEHFMGSIVVIQDGLRRGTIAAFKLVDGQQRLTSLSLLLKALAVTVATETHLIRRIENFLLMGPLKQV